MNKKNILTTLAFACFVPAFAGTMYMTPRNVDSDVYKVGLAEIDSIDLVRENPEDEKRIFMVKKEGLPLYEIQQDKLNRITVSTSLSSENDETPSVEETVSIFWSDGSKDQNGKTNVFEDEFSLVNVASIDIVDTNATLDSDKDGLTDYEEIYIYETNPLESKDS